LKNNRIIKLVEIFNRSLEKGVATDISVRISLVVIGLLVV